MTIEMRKEVENSYSKVYIFNSLALAPVAVRPDMQRKGIGSAEKMENLSQL